MFVRSDATLGRNIRLYRALLPAIDDHCKLSDMNLFRLDCSNTVRLQACKNIPGHVHPPKKQLDFASDASKSTASPTVQRFHQGLQDCFLLIVFLLLTAELLYVRRLHLL